VKGGPITSVGATEEKKMKYYFPHASKIKGAEKAIQRGSKKICSQYSVRRWK